MKIRTQLIASAVILAAILAACSMTFAIGNQRLQQIAKQEEVARNLQQDANEMGFLTNSYLLFHDQSQLTLWQSQMDSISSKLAALKANNQQQQHLIDDMKSNQQRTLEVFTQIKTSIGNNPAAGQSLDYIGTAYSRLAVQNQGIIANANQLSLLLHNQSNQIKQINSQLIFILFVVFGLLILANFVLINRRIIRGLSSLGIGAKVIGSGNLNHVVPVKSKDEIGEVSSAFNQMTSDLKMVTASKSDLEKEIEERKRIQTELESISAQRQLALNAARMGWWHFDPVKNYSWWDERYKEIFGFAEYEKPNDEILATRLYPEDLPGVWAKVESALDPVNPQPYSAEYRINLPDGSIRWIEAYGTATFEGVGKDKHAISLVGTVADITERKKTEEEREHLIKQTSDTLAELQTILDTAPVAIWIARDPECRTITGNTYANELLKVRQGDNISLSALAGEAAVSYRVLRNKVEVPPENLPAQEAAATGKPVTPWEMDLEFEDSRQLHMLVGAVPLFDHDGRVRGSVAVGADITELKKAENRLRESEERFRTLSNTSPIGVGVSSSDGVLLYANPSYELILGYEHAELFGKKASDLYWDPKDRQSWVNDIKNKGFLRNIETRLKRKDGTPVWVSINVSLVIYGGMQAVMGTIEDITKRKKAEEALREARDYLDNLFNYASAPIIVWNPDFEITRFNHAFERLTGRADNEVLGKKLGILFPDDSRDESMQLIQQASGGNRWEAVEIPILNLDGTIRIVLWNSATLYAPDRTAIATIAQGQDITQRRQFEEELRQRTAELEASNKELEAFSYSVSHDLRAPLRSVNGFSGILLEDYHEKLDEEGKLYLRKIQESAKLMGQLIDDLLKLSGVSSGDITYEEVNLSDVAQKIVDALQINEPKRKVKFVIAPDMVIRGDRGLLNRALDNLLHNAWKFSNKAAESQIEVGTIEHNGKQAYFVRDNGVGFDMAYSDKLFTPFQRLHSTSEFAGTGIGLAIVQRIIRRHGGEVWAESKVGEGAAFYFTLS